MIPRGAVKYMADVKVDVTLRPIRFVFLVRPNDKKNILKIFQINTSLWGGKFNPIVPFFKNVPKWWSRHKYQKNIAQQIIDDYLDFFEPDFIVEAEEGLAENIEFDKTRVLTLENFLGEDEHDRNKYGLNVNDLYLHLYDKKYQFERRHKANIVNVTSKEKYLKNFISCIFGSFPEEAEYLYLRENYVDIFEAKDIELNAKSLLELYLSHYAAPLDVGHARIDVNFSERISTPKLFVLDIRETRDLIDFWNLRIIFRNVIAVPKQWVEELSPFCKEFISRYYRPSRWESDHMLSSTTMFSRSISEDDAKSIYSQYIKTDQPEANHVQYWYPDIKLERSDLIQGLRRPALEYQQVKSEVNISDDEDSRVFFETLAPDFAEKYANRIRWANVINFDDWSFQNKITTVFPTNYRNPKYPKFNYYIKEHLLPTTEGLIIFPEYKEQDHKWRLENGTTSINQWLQENGITATVSDAGKSTQQIIENLGGVGQVWSIANKNIVETLDQMARTPLTRSFQIHKFENMINKGIKKTRWQIPRSEVLASQKIVELGLELKCSKCDSWSWYTLKEMDYTLTCNRCLKTFDFPITKPSNSKYSRWSYRVIGPFAIPDYSRGGYAAALAIRLFETNIDYANHLKTTWSAGQELTLTSGEKAEADFILWTQRTKGLQKYETSIVFGEAKSFANDAFKESDIEKMKLLAKTFPKSVLVFAAMKEYEKFSSDEIRRLRKLAEWGRGYDSKNKEVRAHIMILTGLELFIEGYGKLSEVWEQQGGKHQKLISAPSIKYNLADLELLADLTQQVYLDMPSYIEGLRIANNT